MPFPLRIDLATLTAAQGFIIQAADATDYAGYSVSSAGDVNGDGIDDLIVGAPSTSQGGEAYLVFGTRDGFGTADGTGRMVIDAGTLTAAQGFVIQGDATSDFAGFSVSSAGDVNGDGIDDLIVGAPEGDDGGDRAGEAYVVFGTRGGFGSADGAGRQVIDLTGLTAAQGFVIQGDREDDTAGRSVSSAGDVNGDGIDDLIVGAPGGDDGDVNAGEAYVVFGTRGGFGTDAGGRQVIDLTSITPAQGFIVRNDGRGEQAGDSVSSAGDVNGDGIDDLIVGARYGDDGGSNAGEAFVVFGTRAGFGATAGGRQVVDLGALDAAQGFAIRGDVAGDQAAISVSSAGDVNGDGIDDLIVGANLGDDGGADAGEAYVVFGTRSGFGTVIDLTTLSAAQGFVIQGDAAGDRAGRGVSGAGDVNGDGIDDLIVGADMGDDGNFNAGEAYVVFGTRAGFGTDVGGRQVLDLTALTAAQGFIVEGEGLGDHAGLSVAGAGDIDGDGVDDLIIGAIHGNNGGMRAGEAYVIYGQTAAYDPAWPAQIPVASLGADGFRILGSGNQHNLGYSVSGSGDFNGDGFDDVVVVATGDDAGGENAGAAWLIYGKASGFANIDLGTALDPAQGFQIRGTAGDSLGSASLGGDVNGDGYDDIVVGGQLHDVGGENAGAAWVIFGRAPAPGTIDLATALAPADGFKIVGANDFDFTGDNVSSGGDFNGDGIDDIVVSAMGSDLGGNFAGAAWVIFGKTSGFGTIDLADPIDPADGFVLQHSATFEYAGSGVSLTGDINGDGFDDLLIGAGGDDQGGNNAGAVFVVFGKATGFATVDLATLPGSAGFKIVGDAIQDNIGYALSAAGDINGDGFADIVVGAPRSDAVGANSGASYVIFGKAAGFGTIDLGTALDPAIGFRIQSAAAADRTGQSVSSGGDVNGDGYDDLIVGADGANGAPSAVYLVFGKASGFGTLDLASFSAADGVKLIDGGNRLGYSVSAAGDIDQDGRDDLIVGAYSDDQGGTNAGAAYVIFGRQVEVNSAPTQAANAGLTVFEGTVGTITAASLDYDDTQQADTAIVYTVTSAATNGTLRLNGSALGIGGTFTQDDIANSRVSFLHDGSETTSASFGFSVSDGDGGTTSGQSFAITVTPVDDAPVAANDSFDTDELTVKTGNLLVDNGSGADSDPDGATVLQVTAVNGVAGNVGTQITLLSGALLTVNADGTFSYDSYGLFIGLPGPASGASNLSGTDSFAYTLTGGDTATVTITITGVDNNDVAQGTAGNDTIDGGVGANTLSYSNATAGVFANIGVSGPHDTVGAGIDTVSNFANLLGSPFADELRGSAAANRLTGGAGADVMLGGDGNDLYVVDNAGDRVREAANQGNDTVSSSVSYVLPDSEVENLTLTGSAVSGGGNRFDNTLTGNSVANSLAGYAGDDRIDGGGGADVMAGGLGDDTYVVDNGGDRIRESDDQGTDTVETSVDYTLPGIEIERIVITGSGAVNVTGNGEDNIITGNRGANSINGAGGADRIDGGVGADVMAGGLGDDIFVVDDAGDRIKERANEGTDTVETALSFSLQGLEVENLTLTGGGTVDGTGNGLANLIIGNGAANALLGYEGDDALRGEDGDDALHGMGGSDRMEGGAGADRFYFDATIDGLDVDTIADFEASVDSIWLRRAKFDGMALGTLSADAFAIGSHAADASDRILYDSATGALYFDPDGTGAAEAILFATLGTGLSLTAADFTIF